MEIKNELQRLLRVGVDFGGVLSCHSGDRGSGGHVNVSIDMKLGLDSLYTLKQISSLHLVSFCGATRAKETAASINKIDTKLFDGGLYFTSDSKAPAKDKGYVCQMLGLDVLIDDTLDILEDIAKHNQCPVLIWFKGDPQFKDDRKASHASILEARDWSDVVTICTKLQPYPIRPNPSIVPKKKLYPI